MKCNVIKTLLFVCSLQTVATADENWDFLSMKGYGTLGVAYQDNDKLLYRNSFFSDKGSKGDLSFDNYSVFGLQANMKVNDRIRVTIQGVASSNNSNGKFLDFDWANVNYDLGNQFDLRVGLMRTPALMYSDILNVAYTYDWIHLPDMYGLISINKYTGAQLSHQYHVKDLSLYSSIWYGTTGSDFKVIDQTGTTSISHVDASKLYGLTLKLVYNNFLIRGSYIMSDVTINSKESDNLFNQLTSMNIPQVNDAVSMYRVVDKPISYFNIGSRYDYKTFYIQGEYIGVNSDSLAPDIKSWNTSAGYSIGDYTPYLSYSKTSSRSNFVPISAVGLSAQATVGVITANQTLGFLAQGIQDMNVKTTSLGLRYELAEDIALKFQYNEQRISVETLDVFSASVNFIF